MLGPKIFTASLLFIGAAFAQLNYLPLNSGNIWTYKTTHRGYLTLRIEREQIFDSKTYSLLTGLPSGEVWLRSDDHGSVYALNTSTRQEQLWYDFGAPAGGTYSTAIPATGGQAQVRTRNGDFKSRIGSFNNALEILYPQVTQPGIAGDTFLPWVGLVYRSELAGIVESHWELVYASLGGVTVISQPETSFAVSVDAISESIRLTLRHTGPMPLELTFNSSQTYDFNLFNDRGESVYSWSSNKLFAPVVRNEKISGERTWIDALPSLPPGQYTAVAYLTLAEGVNLFRATVPFTVQIVPASN